jgi:hypothetical protein
MSDTTAPKQSAQQATGNFVAFLNRDKQPGDNRPIFVNGRIAKPGSEEEFPLTLWAFNYTNTKTGEVLTGFNGSIGAVSPDAAAIDQIQALLKQETPDAIVAAGNLSINPRQVVIFTNGFKDEAPDKERPTHYGYANFGDGTPLVKASVWLGKDRYERAYVHGTTQYPLTKEEAAALKAPEVKPAAAKNKVAPPPPPAPAQRDGR